MDIEFYANIAEIVGGTIVVVTTGNLAMVGAGAGGGWRYDTTSGKYIADDTNTDGNGVAYDSY